ncbi:hypothetical protein OS493_029249 [Desmophyllum pertusum]|uniref:DED domain-containing protein n=1 Tax=Desmophyllum pertusum TaxID=174260 RepID=A0A9W9ZLT2_9CNID|nr:hypothetical protein OS493_029249 [Desmophyllum pertusum]
MALRTATSGLNASCPPGRPPAYGIFRYEHPPIFKKFIVHFVRLLSNDDRVAFSYWCKGIVPGSKLDGINVGNDSDIYKLVEFLQSADELSFTNMSLLKEFLLSVGHHELLQELESVELCISIGCILEDYIKFKSVDDFHLKCMKLADSYATIVEFLLTTKEENQELISLVLEQLRQVSDDSKLLEILELLSSQLSWSIVTSTLVITGVLYASFGQVAASGYYVCAFSDTRTSELLTRWILKNGGLKAFDEFIRNKQEVASNGSALSSIGESIKENIKLLGNRIDIQSE